MKKLLGFILVLPFLAWATVRIVADIQYSRYCGDHLKRAADANTVELAIQEMDVSLAYIEARGLTQGYTNVLWTTPDCDMGFWYKNLTQARDELRAVKPETTMLERTNILMKLRETLLDHSGESGREKVTQPGGISIAPNNAEYAWWGLVSLVVGFIGVILFLGGLESY